MFQPITNPYIVGNPIKTKKMFYGREDDFEFIRRKLESGSKSYIIVLSGERRSGKTSILFQILNGQLGENFIPILIDMQTMAGLKNESEFFEKLAQETLKYLDNRFSLDKYPFHQKESNPYKLFSELLDEIHRTHPDKTKLFLIDEYELIEVKSEEGSLSQNFVPFLSGVLESERHISFIFTGSRTLEERGTRYWQNLFGKSLFRNVSFLSEQDTMRLITQPVDGKITFEPGVLTSIYRLTSGQPFYTQIVGQNIVDFVNETQKTNIESADLEQIVNEILENPLPQMIYFWNSLPPGQMLILSLLAEVIDDPETNLSVAEIIKLIKKKKLGISLDSQLINTVLETLYHQKYVSKSGSEYSFQIDLMRQWIQRDHSIWRVLKEVDIESIIQSEKQSSVSIQYDSDIKSAGGKKIWITAAAVVLALIIAFFTWRQFSGSGKDQPQRTTAQSLREEGAAGRKEISLPSESSSPPQTMAVQEANQKRREVKSPPTEIRQTIPAPVKKSESAGTGKSDPGKEDFQKSRELMLDSKTRAVQVKAPDLAAETYAKAENTEETAEKLGMQNNYLAAAEKFNEAQMIFEKAVTESRGAMKIEEDKYQNSRQQLEKIKTGLKAEHKLLPEYEQAEEFQNKGKDQADQGQFNLAYDNNTKAIRLYEMTVQKRIEDKEKIRGAIDGYVQAIKAKDFRNSTFIKADYKSELQNQWKPFFDLAEDIKIDYKINEIEFEKNGAQAKVVVTMQYSGAGGSGNSAEWNVKLTEERSNWVIANIQ